jgi:hypothetical protein
MWIYPATSSYLEVYNHTSKHSWHFLSWSDVKGIWIVKNLEKRTQVVGGPKELADLVIG